MDDDQARAQFREVMARLAPFVEPVEVRSCEGLSDATLSLFPNDGGSVNVRFRGRTASGAEVSGDTRLTVTPAGEVLARDADGAPWGFAERTS